MKLLLPIAIALSVIGCTEREMNSMKARVEKFNSNLSPATCDMESMRPDYSCDIRRDERDRLNEKTRLRGTGKILSTIDCPYVANPDWLRCTEKQAKVDSLDSIINGGRD